MNFIDAIREGKAKDRAIRIAYWNNAYFVYYTTRDNLEVIGPNGNANSNMIACSPTDQDWELCKDRDWHGNPIKPEPKFRQWQSIEEMGEAVNHWFRQKHTIVKLRVEASYLESIDLSDEKNRSLNELCLNYEHSPTPWIADSWKPCGVEK